MLTPFHVVSDANQISVLHGAPGPTHLHLDSVGVRTATGGTQWGMHSYIGVRNGCTHLNRGISLRWFEFAIDRYRNIDCTIVISDAESLHMQSFSRINVV